VTGDFRVPKCRIKSDRKFRAFGLFIRHPGGYKRTLSLLPASGVSPITRHAGTKWRRQQIERMTELNSKWDVAACLRIYGFPAVAMWLVIALPEIAAADDRSVEAVGLVAEASPTHSAASIRSNLASVAASAFEPGRDGVVDLATFGTKPAAAVLNVPPPGSLSPTPPVEDHIPEPSAIGFGLAVAALIVGNFTKALMRCWKITSASPSREE
jgi:hypothetical protein